MPKRSWHFRDFSCKSTSVVNPNHAEPRRIYNWGFTVFVYLMFWNWKSIFRFSFTTESRFFGVFLQNEKKQTKNRLLVSKKKKTEPTAIFAALVKAKVPPSRRPNCTGTFERTGWDLFSILFYIPNVHLRKKLHGFIHLLLQILPQRNSIDINIQQKCCFPWASDYWQKSRFDRWNFTLERGMKILFCRLVKGSRKPPALSLEVWGQGY